MNQETILWKGSSSQWLNAGHFLATLVVAGAIVAGGVVFPPAFIALVLPLGYMLWRYLLVRTRLYELTSERVRVTWGVVNQNMDDIELYRVKDTQLQRPWWMRLTGLASVKLETSDRSMPELMVPAVRGGLAFRELLRKQVEIQRDRKRVREMDFADGAMEGLDFDADHLG
jgi:uncharacterized membrane protein YdbT with pleckstrin-like domain